jgi:hypothetical protein
MKSISNKKLAVIALIGISFFISLDLYSDIIGDDAIICHCDTCINDSAINDGDGSNDKINFIYLSNNDIELIYLFSFLDLQFSNSSYRTLADTSHIFYERYFKYIVYSKGSFV